LFKRYRWPGNVRELENTIKSSIILAKERVLPQHLPFHFSKTKDMEIGTNKSTTDEYLNLASYPDKTSMKQVRRDMSERIERQFIEKTLDSTNWNKKRAAQLLDIDYKSLFTKIKKYGIKR